MMLIVFLTVTLLNNTEHEKKQTGNHRQITRVVLI